MSQTPEEITNTLKTFIWKKSKLLKGQELPSDTALFSSGALDSLAFIQLVSYVEKQFNVRLSSVTAVTMNNLDTVGALVSRIAEAQAKNQN